MTNWRLGIVAWTESATGVTVLALTDEVPSPLVLREPGATVWRLLASSDVEGVEESRLIADIVACFGASSRTVSTDLKPFLAQLATSGLLIARTAAERAG